MDMKSETWHITVRRLAKNCVVVACLDIIKSCSEGKRLTSPPSQLQLPQEFMRGGGYNFLSHVISDPV
jgi:hypothetical protein